MTRAEYRRAEREKSKKYFFTGEQLQERESTLIDEATYKAFILFLGIGTLVIKDDFGKLMKKEGRESKFIDSVLAKYHALEKDEVGVDEMKAVIRENSDITEI